MPRVHFPSNAETPNLKIENSIPEIHSSGTELLLKKLKILGPNEKTIQKFHI
jgi:hypothetical protein